MARASRQAGAHAHSAAAQCVPCALPFALKLLCPLLRWQCRPMVTHCATCGHVLRCHMHLQVSSFDLISRSQPEQQLSVKVRRLGEFGSGSGNGSGTNTFQQQGWGAVDDSSTQVGWAQALALAQAQVGEALAVLN